jgi:hypothetical protein
VKLTRSQLRRLIRDITILEGYDKSFTCNDMGHSNGFVLPNGDYIDLSETPYNTHDEYIEANINTINPDNEKMVRTSKISTQLQYKGFYLPANFITVSNPKHWAIEHPDWSVATDAQIHGMIDCMLSCKNNSPWIKNNIETEQILFFHTGFAASMNYMTFPEFLEIYGNRSHMDRLFNELMG